MACCTAAAWALLMLWQSQCLQMVQWKCVGKKPKLLFYLWRNDFDYNGQHVTVQINLLFFIWFWSVPAFINTGWIKKELYWVYVAAKLVPAAFLASTGGLSWPKAKAAAQPVLLEVSWREGNWDLGMEHLVTMMSPTQALDETPERR